MSSKRQRDTEEGSLGEENASTPEKRRRLDASEAADERTAAGPSGDAAGGDAEAARGDGTAATVAEAGPSGSAAAALADAGGEDASAAAAAAAQNGAAAESESDDEPVLPAAGRRGGVKKGSECPYLDTISRQVGRCPAGLGPSEACCKRRSVHTCLCLPASSSMQVSDLLWHRVRRGAASA